MRIQLITVFSIGLTIQSFGCDCKERTLAEYQATEFTISQMVFIADVVSSNIKKGTYKLRIIELFKGEVRDSIVSGDLQESCSGFAEKGRWIIYAASSKSGRIFFSSCGISRSFNSPERTLVKDYLIPLPPRAQKDPKRSSQEIIEFHKSISKIKEKALTDLESEIDRLRKMKQ